MMMFLFWVLIGFIAVEASSYVLHRFIFHGPLWRLHRTHHFGKDGRLEINDIFSLIFTIFTVVLMARAESVWDSIAFALSTGFTLYGICYFIAHDIYTHRRIFGHLFGHIFSCRRKCAWMQAIGAAHRHHHQDVSRKGHEPYGLFWFRGYRQAKTPTSDKIAGRRVKSG